mgnify:CR=1 FL=1
MPPEQALLAALAFMVGTTVLGWAVYALWTWAGRQRRR